jgi:F0F1-type ATP synthase epsilon subunit
VRIAPNEVSVSDPAAMKQIYAVNAGYTKVRSPNIEVNAEAMY